MCSVTIPPWQSGIRSEGSKDRHFYFNTTCNSGIITFVSGQLMLNYIKFLLFELRSFLACSCEQTHVEFIQVLANGVGVLYYAVISNEADNDETPNDKSIAHLIVVIRSKVTSPLLHDSACD